MGGTRGVRYTVEQKIRAVLAYDGLGADRAMRELGYPGSRATLYKWLRERRDGTLGSPGARRRGRYSDAERALAVERYLANGRRNLETRLELGYPSCGRTLAAWVDELAPGARPGRDAAPASPLERAGCLAALARGAGVSEAARACGRHRDTVRRWRDRAAAAGVAYHRGGAAEATEAEVADVADIPEGLPQDPGELLAHVRALEERARELEREVVALELERDVYRETARILGKGGAGPEGLTGAERAELVDSLRPAHPLKDILAEIGWNRSSYHYQRRRREVPDRYAELRPAVRDAFEEGRGAYGYRRVRAVLGRDGVRVSEKVVRRIMAEEGLVARTSRKRRRFSTYVGETAEAPANLVARDFHADAPNRLWLSDFTEFKIPAGKAYLSPVLDCFCGELASWSISTSPNARLADSSLEAACALLAAGEHPVTHTDRGAPYRWPGWVSICEGHELARSMSAKGCSPDNAACEGLFGRIKVEFFHGRDWSGVTLDDFMGELDDYLRWYNEGRIKASLGYMSPTEYRIAWERARRAAEDCEASVTS